MTDQQYKFLSFIYRKPRTIRKLCKLMSMSDDALQSFCADKFINDRLTFQQKDEFSDSLVKVNTEGENAYEERRRSNIRFRLPTIISIIAIVISVIALLCSLGLLKPILPY